MDDFKQPPKQPLPKFSPPKLDQLNTVKPEPPFKAPDEIEEINLGDLDVKLEDSPAKKEPPIKSKMPKLSRKKLLIIAGVVFGVLLIIATAYWFFLRPKSDQNNSSAPTSSAKKAAAKAKPTSPLTGVELSDASLASRPVTGLMIENSPDARPQSGIIDSGVVFEAVAEGGITRFLVIFQDTQPQYIGPIRSVRPYYIDFALGFNAGLGHVGGSPDALNDIKNLSVRDLDQFFNSQAYWRITERYAPHNVYSSFAKLDALNTSKGYKATSYKTFERKKDVPQTPTASIIDFAISGPLYSPEFQYNNTTNSYKRFQNGAPHVDQKSNAQISPKVVIALVMDKGLMADGSHTTYNDVGSGKMYVFQDGIVSEGTWSKADRKSQFSFTDKNGLAMKLNAGQTWISIVGSSSDVSYKP